MPKLKAQSLMVSKVPKHPCHTHQQCCDKNSHPISKWTGNKPKETPRRTVQKSGGAGSNVVGIIFLPVGIGLTDLPKTGGAKAPPALSLLRHLWAKRADVSVTFWKCYNTCTKSLIILLTNKNIPAFLTASLASNGPRDSFVGVICIRVFERSILFWGNFVIPYFRE